jgi:hypothetical protein
VGVGGTEDCLLSCKLRGLVLVYQLSVSSDKLTGNGGKDFFVMLRQPPRSTRRHISEDSNLHEYAIGVFIQNLQARDPA